MPVDALPPNVGLIFLEDLHSPAPWRADHAPSWLRQGGRGGKLLGPRIFPPPGLVVVAHPETLDGLRLSVDWLKLAARLELIIDGRKRPSPRFPHPLGPLEPDELEAVLAPLAGKCRVRSVSTDVDVAILEALDRVRTEEPWAAWATSPMHACFPVGSWRRIDRRMPDWMGPTLDPEWELHQLVRATAIGDAGVWMYDASADKALDLVTGATRPGPGLEPSDAGWRGSMVFPGARRWLREHRRDHSGRYGWRIDGEVKGTPRPGRYGEVISAEPGARVFFTGARCRFDWSLVTHTGPCYWTPSDHHWPLGHAKKLYGYEDNDPLWVHLAPDASACLSIYEHDTLLTPGLPLVWRDVGGFTIAERARGQPRALCFQRTDAEDAFLGDPTTGDEDARDRFATASLGPDESLRYVLGLDAPTWRMRDIEAETAERIDGRNEWVVFDAEHREVSRQPGRLLAGWHRWIVIEREGKLWRHDLVHDRLEELCDVDRPIAGAIAMPGTPNVIIMSEVEGNLFVRLL